MDHPTIDFFLRLHGEDHDRIRDCLNSLNHAQLWQPCPDGVSVGNLICHVCEMEQFWIDWGLTMQPFDRDREIEFTRTGDCSGTELSQRITNRIKATTVAIQGLDQSSWLQERVFHGDTFTGEGILLWHIHHLGLHRGHIQAHTRWLRSSL